MLWRLARLSHKHKKKAELSKVSEEIMSIDSSNPLQIQQHFQIMGFLMGNDEFKRVEQFLEMVEAWPEERFTKQSQYIERESLLDEVENDIHEIKVQIGGKKKSGYLRRVEKLIQRLGIQDQKVTDEELYKEFHRRGLERVWESIY